jgi:uncharacterized protein YggE
MGVDLVRVVGFSEGGYGGSPVPMYSNVMAKDMGMGGGGSVAPDIQSGSLDVTSHVSVSFEIR